MRLDLLHNVSRAALEHAAGPLSVTPEYGTSFASVMGAQAPRECVASAAPLGGGEPFPVRQVEKTALPSVEGAEPLSGLRLGDRGPKVARLQKILRKWNSQLDVGTPGVYDQRTRDALTLYKAIYGSGSTGQRVDEQTARYLRQMEDGTFWSNPPAKTPGQEMLYHASRRLGTPYVMGGDGRRSTDCGMLTKQAMADARMGSGVSRLADLQYLSAKQRQGGLSLAKGEPQAGDLVFYRVPTSQSGIAVDGVTHVTMYVGDGLMLGASSGRGRVVLQPTSDLGAYVAGYGRVANGADQAG